jgi:hypothetical protein
MLTALIALAFIHAPTDPPPPNPLQCKQVNGPPSVAMPMEALRHVTRSGVSRCTPR